MSRAGRARDIYPLWKKLKGSEKNKIFFEK